MAFNNGSRLTVFGLSYSQHDNRHMQQILRQYGRLPHNPGNRGDLFLGLFALARDLNKNDIQGIENWLRDGGEFPAPSPATAPAAASSNSPPTISDEWSDDDDDDWPEYNPAEFESTAPDMEVDHDDLDEEVDHDGLGEDFDLQPEEEDHVHDAQPAERFGEQVGFAADEEMLVTTLAFDYQNVEVHEARGSVDLSRHTDTFPAGYTECNICITTLPPSDFPASSKITASCNHDQEYKACLVCLEQGIEASVKVGALNRLVCPFCPERLSSDEIKTYASQEIFTR